MGAYEQKELAPRDVVSQEIFHQIQKQNKDYVFLDVRHLDTEKLYAHFPNLLGKVKEQGIDIKNEGIPVAPAAHYCIGGVATDLDARTNIKGLYACGEVAATGVHGANRLASNSLLECLVFSKRAVRHASAIDHKPKGTFLSNFMIRDEAGEEFTALQQKVSELLSRHAGIQRNREGLEQAESQFQELIERLPEKRNEYYAMRSRGLVQLAKLIARSALEREESRGVHTRTDFPGSSSAYKHISFQKPIEHSEVF